MTGKCFIWDTNPEVREDSNDNVFVTSPRSGKYKSDSSVAQSLSQLADANKVKLTDWIINQNKQDPGYAWIDSEVIEQVKNARPKPWSSRVDDLLLHWEREGYGIETSVQDVWSNIIYLNPELDSPQSEGFCAFSSCKNAVELRHFFETLKDQNYFNEKYYPSAKFLERLEQLRSTNIDSTQAFVAMWFDESVNNAYENGFDKGIKDCGLSAFRIDKKDHNNKICDEIILEIRRSKLVIADFTCGFTKETEPQAIARGGVYYEAGFAQGLGIPVIWTCRADCLDHVHFDTRQYNHIVWETPEELRTKLSHRIKALGLDINTPSKP